jgi:hypothetical protein
VELIILDDHPRLRVSIWTRWGRYLIAYCRTVDEVAEHVELGDLVELIELRRPSRARLRAWSEGG